MNIEESALRELISNAPTTSLAVGDVLVREGDEATHVFYLRSGQLTATTSTSSADVPVNTIEPGGLVGEIAVVTGRVRTATLTASQPSEVVTIPRATFEQWLATQPGVAHEVTLAARERLDRSQVAIMIELLIGASSPAVVRDMLDSLTWHRMEAGRVLFREGDESDAAYFVVSGRLEAVTTNAAGEERVLNEMGNGDVVGELGLIDGAPRAATVRAVRDATLARFSAASFEHLMARHASLAFHVARSVLRHGARATVRSRASVVTLAITAPIDHDAFTRRFLAEVERFGTSVHLSSGRVDALLDTPAISQADVDKVGVPRLSAFLHKADLEHERVVYQCDAGPDLTSWSRRSLRHGDRVVLVMSAQPDAHEAALLRTYAEELRGIEGRSLWLAVVHGANSRPHGSTDLTRQYGAADIVHLRTNGSHDAGVEHLDIERLARISIGRGYGLVLSGGGARGFAHIGVVRAMRELGIPIDRVGGTSIGAPIGALVAMMLPNDEILDTVTRQFHKLLDYTIPVVSVLKGERISKSIASTFGGWDITDLMLGFYCISTNLSASRLQMHTSGDLAVAVRASVAIPGVLPPVPFHGDLLVDGGVLANLPVQQMRDHSGVGTIIAIDVSPTSGPAARTDFGHSLSGWRALRASIGRRQPAYPSLSSVLIRTMMLGSVHEQTSARYSAEDAFVKVDIKGVGLLDFEKVKPVADAGYDIARPALEGWLRTRDCASSR